MLKILSIATVVALSATLPAPGAYAMSAFPTHVATGAALESPTNGAAVVPAQDEPSATPDPTGSATPPASPSPTPVPTPTGAPLPATSPSPSPTADRQRTASPTPSPDVTPTSALEATTAAGLVTAESFGSADDWTLVSGRGSISSSTDATEGGRSLKMDYDFGGGTFEIGRVATPQDIDTTGLRALKLDVKGDGSFNTLYLRVRDATGEVLYYRVGNISNKNWTTATVDLSKAPSATTGGNGDGIIDAPIALFRLVVVRNGTQPATGSVRVDNLRVDDSGWTAPRASTGSIIPGSGTTDVSFTAGGAGDYRLRLIDPAGNTRTFTGAVQAAKTETNRWDGTSDGGAPLAGVVRAVLEYDSAADGKLSGQLTVATPYLVGAAQRAASATAGSVAAVNSSLTTYESLSKADTDAAAMEDAYVRYAREEFEWNRVEPRKGFFDWPKFDQAVSVARARNIDIIGKLVYTADWATSAPAGTPSSSARYYPPADYADYVNYAVATVERYKDRVKVWEIWNEPNIVQYWKPSPDASAYARLLKATYAAIKEADPDAIVLTGGLAGYSEQFLNSLRDAGAIDSFDGIGLHTYVQGAPESSTIDSWISAAQSWIARNAPGRSLWITETGWSTCTSCGSGAGVSEADQAAYLSRSMIDAAAHGVAAYAWFNLVEIGGSASRLDNYGLIEQSGRKKPAYSALARTGAGMAGSVAAGTASPSAGTSTVLSDLARTTDVKSKSLGEGATSKVSAVTTRVAGSGAIALDYNYKASTAEGTSLTMNLPVSGRPSAVSVWTYGDNSNSSIYMKITDAKGEIFEGKVGNAGPEGWSRQTLYFDGLNPSYKSYGSNVDKKIDYPITVTDVHVFKSSTSKTSGRIIFDDVTAHYGTSTRGVVFYGRNFVTQALYRPDFATTRIPVANTTAYIYDRGALQAVPVDSSLGAEVTVSSAPKFLVSSNRVNPSSVKPGSSVSLRLVTGDRTTITVQIYTKSGKLVRTITDSRSYLSGAREIAWDGKVTGGAVASPGDYRFRISVSGPDGRSVAWGRPFTIAG